MLKNKILYIFVLTLISSVALFSVLIFPAATGNPATFSQLRQNKEKTMNKYKDDWISTKIIQASSAPTYEYGNQVATITIPAMEIYELPVYYGADPVSNNWQITTPGHAGNWSVFGESGVTCVGAHNYQLFKDLKLLKPGDKVLVETDIDRYVYTVYDTGIYHHETDNWDDIATRHQDDYALNLMTCYPFDAVKTNDMYIVYTSLQKGSVFNTL